MCVQLDLLVFLSFLNEATLNYKESIGGSIAGSSVNSIYPPALDEITVLSALFGLLKYIASTCD